jgi:DNA-binding transcriptional LysR family regulator
MITVNGALDVRMMRTLWILITECSVSRTAEILGLTQPTASLALKRLRELLGDPILVRSGGALVPTERALELRETLPRLLATIDAQLAPLPDFVPAQSDRRFRIVAANCLGAVFIPRIFATAAIEAPNVALEIVPMPQHDDLMAHLSDGTIDLVIGNWPKPPEQLRIAPLLSTPIKCVTQPDHPLARLDRRMTLDDYLAARHLTPSADQRRQFSPIDGRLMELGRARRIVASVPEYALAPHVLAMSDLVFTTGAPFAEQIAREHGFALLDAPEDFGNMDFYLLWHDCKHHSPAHHWLRRLLKRIAGGLKAPNSDMIFQIAAE